MGKRRVEVSWAGGEHEQGTEEGHLGGELIGKVDVADVCNNEPNKTNEKYFGQPWSSPLQEDASSTGKRQEVPTPGQRQDGAESALHGAFLLGFDRIWGV